MGRYFAKGLADSTQKSYSSSQKCFLQFSRDAALRPSPVSESALCYFAACSAKERLKHRTIKAYLSGVRFLHIAQSYSDPFQQTLNRLHYVLQGIKRIKSEGAQTNKSRLLMSPMLLRKMKKVWFTDSVIPDSPMLWAACCLTFENWRNGSPRACLTIAIPR